MAAPFDLRNFPAMLPPPGRKSDFDNPETMHSELFGVAVGTMALICVVVTIRIYTKGFLMRDMKLEEYFCLLATASIISWDSIFIHVSLGGFSRHFWDVRAVDVAHLAYMNYLGEISNAIAMWAAKCSILFQLKTLFCPGESRSFNFWAIVGMLFINTGFHLASLLSFIFQCTPREKALYPLMPGQCINVAAATIVSGAVNLFLDMGILVLPIFAVCHLRLPLKQKVGISAVFAVGILTCGIAAYGVALRVPLLWDPDLTWIITRVGIWTMVEYAGTILVGCMPSFPRFFLRLRGREPSVSSSAANSKSSRLTGRTIAANSIKRLSAAKRDSATTAAVSSPVQAKHLSITQVGLAVTTSEVSLVAEPTYYHSDLEKAQGHHEYEHQEHALSPPAAVRFSEGRGRGSYDADWSPLPERR